MNHKWDNGVCFRDSGHAFRIVGFKRKISINFFDFLSQKFSSLGFCCIDVFYKINISKPFIYVFL